MKFMMNTDIFDYLDSFVLKGKDGAEKIQNLMTSFRNKGTALFDGIEEVIDFSTGIWRFAKRKCSQIYLERRFVDGSSPIGYRA